MSSISVPEKGVVRHSDEQFQPISRRLEWLISVCLVLAGSVFAIGGYLVSGLADLNRITSWVASGRISSTEMSDAELVDAVYALLWGGGIGVMITGALLVVAGVAYFRFQTRARRRFEATGSAAVSSFGNAILGAAVTVVGAVIPFSPVLGGAVTGYLHGDADGSAIRTGVFAGLLASLPVVIVFGLMTWSLLGSATGLTAIVLVVLAVSLVLTVAYMVGLSALGGYLGAEVATSERPVDA